MSIPESAILFRCGGAALAKYGVPWRRRRTDGREPEAPTFARADATTCATRITRAGLVRLAAANKLRLEWVDPNGDGVRETPVFVPEGSRPNLVENGDAESDVVGIMGANGGETITRDATHPMSGGFAAKVTTQNVSGSGHWYRKRDTNRIAASAATAYAFSAWIYAESDAVGKTMVLAINWWNSTPAVISTSTSPNKVLVAGWQRVAFAATSPSGTVTCQPVFQTNGVLGVFNYWADLGQFEPGTFESSAIPTNTAAVTRAADNLTFPIGFGPQDLTVYAKLARPVWADASGTLGVAPGIIDIGNEVNHHLRMYHQDTTRQVVAAVMTSPGVGQSAPTQNIPAGTTLTYAAQFADLTTAGRTRFDVGGGAGFGAWSSTVAAQAAFGSQVLRVGAVSGGANPLFGGLIDLIVARGLYTLADFAGT